MPRSRPDPDKQPWPPTSIRLHPDLRRVLYNAARKDNQLLSHYIVRILMEAMEWEPPEIDK